MIVCKQEKLSAELFHIALVMEVELVSETLDFISHLTHLSAHEDLIESTWFSMAYLP